MMKLESPKAMTREELLPQLQTGESEFFEAKEARQGVPENAYKTVSAFANTAGGRIALGVRESEAHFLRDASHETFDGTISAAEPNDLDGEAITWFRNLLAERGKDPLRAGAELDREAFLRNTGLLRKTGLTHAAALMFGLPPIMSHLKPGGIVDFRLFDRDAKTASHNDWDDRELADGHIVGALRTLVERLRRLSPNPFEMESNGVQHRAFSRDFLAVREAFINLLVHQDYSDRHRTAKILWYRDRVLFENPGDSYLSAQELRDGGRSMPRNPLLARLMRQAGFIEQAGRGIVQILERWREAGREPPEIVNDPGRKMYGLWLSWRPDRSLAESADLGLLPVGVCSFQGREAEIEVWSQDFLSLSAFFQGNLQMAKVDWPEIYRRLAAFLKGAVARRPAIHLDLAVKQSIAFAAGYLVDAEAGIKVVVRQRSLRGTEDWRIDEPETTDAPSWEIAEQTFDGEGVEIALVVSAAHPISSSVGRYVRTSLPAVGKILEFKPPGGPGQLSISSGGQAFRLAEGISHEIFRLAAETGGRSRFHLFFAGPNGLLFFLGQLLHIPQTIQLYEYGFDGQGEATYAPSLSFPPPEP
jgi:hypothetical protein